MDTEAKGTITHTSLFALVDEQAAPPEPVVAAFTEDLLDGFSEFLEGRISGGCTIEVQFVNQSTGAEEFFWDFGDGETSTERDPVHTYSAPSEGGGDFWTVALVAVGPEGTDETRKVDYIEHRQCVR
jgi:hypothetical protein